MKLKIFISVIFLLSVMSLFLAYSSDSTEAMVTYDNQTPSDAVSEGQILVYGDKVILNVHGVKWVSYEATGSMKPVLDEGANGLEVVPKSEADLKIGDIVSYQALWNSNLVVHRIVDMGEDAFGKYYVLKGDNNDEADPGKVRFSQIKYKTIAIIY